MHIRRALISVYDKAGVVEFARALHAEFGIEIISTGGTARLLKENGIPVTLVEDITGFPEMLDGRVKTLHPKIFAAILADRDNPEHMRQLDEMGIKPIDMVVVNLYPFEKTVADPNCTFEQAIEMIDIGGVSLLRAAAKNHKHVLVPTYVADFDSILVWMRGDELSDDGWRCIRRDYAVAALCDTALYDLTISNWLRAFGTNAAPTSYRWLHLIETGRLRYGENPHQSSESLEHADGNNTHALETVEDQAASASSSPSHNNYLDADAALRLCADLSRERAKLLSSQSKARKKCGTGFQPVKCSTGFQPVHEGGFDPVDHEKHTKRNLPHIETPGKVYFVTFRLKDAGSLAPDEREIVFNACLHWHKVKIDLHAVVVMPDHVHLLMTPLEKSAGQWVSLGEVLHSIKRFSSFEINKLRGQSGALWLDESFDRIMRNEKEYLETWEYIRTNPLRKELAEDNKYRWFWDETMPAPSRNMHRLETCATRHRLETGATHHSLETGATPHRLETGATPPPSETGTTPRPLETCATDPGLETGATLSENGSTRACVFVKHNNACGVGIAADPTDAYRRAYLGDPNAAMGGVLAVNFEVTPDFAAAVLETFDRIGRPLKDAGAPNAPGAFFLEVWVAPGFTEDAVKLIRGTAEPTAAIPNPPKKPWGEKVRLLVVGDMDIEPDPNALEYRSIAGGMLVQTPDLVGLNEEQWKVVTKRAPTESEMSDLRLAWLIAKHTKSNAISLVQDGMLIGNGAGQMSRVMSCRIAVWLARENGHLAEGTGAQRHEGTEAESEMKSARAEVRGSSTPLPDGRGSVTPVAASDAFFPFRDGPDLLIDAGVTAIIQPGGSKRDAEVIAACDDRGVAMVFTGTRHFRH